MLCARLRLRLGPALPSHRNVNIYAELTYFFVNFPVTLIRSHPYAERMHETRIPS